MYEALRGKGMALTAFKSTCFICPQKVLTPGLVFGKAVEAEESSEEEEDEDEGAPRDDASSKSKEKRRKKKEKDRQESTSSSSLAFFGHIIVRI